MREVSKRTDDEQEIRNLHLNLTELNKKETEIQKYTNLVLKQIYWLTDNKYMTFGKMNWSEKDNNCKVVQNSHKQTSPMICIE